MKHVSNALKLEGFSNLTMITLEAQGINNFSNFWLDVSSATLCLV